MKMNYTCKQRSWYSGLILAFTLVFGAAVIMATPARTSAQNNQCSPPEFSITSSKSITALAGESFTYFVVTSGETNYRLASQLPSGLSFSAGKISGTPQSTGEYDLRFVASNSCGSTSQTVQLSVVSSDMLAQSTAADDNTNGQTQEDVRLNQVPETGLSADRALTVAFYLLALLLLSLFGAHRLYARAATAEADTSKALRDRW